MRWLLAWFTVWFIVTAPLLLTVAGSLWSLRRWTALGYVDGACWAQWTAMALLMPAMAGATLASAAIISVLLCGEIQHSFAHACLHPVRHWCGHSSPLVVNNTRWLLWLIVFWLTITSALVIFSSYRQPARRLFPPSRKLRIAAEKLTWDDRLTLWEAETKEAAGLVGLGRPFVFVSRWLLARLDLPTLQVVLRHELAHWYRQDNWMRWLLFTVAVLFSFVPLVRWLYREWRQACEEAADDWAAPDPLTARFLAKALHVVLHAAPSSGLGLTSEGIARRIARLHRNSRTITKTFEVIRLSTFGISLILTLLAFVFPSVWWTLHCFAEVPL